MIKLVRKTSDGEIHSDEIFEVESLEAFVRSSNDASRAAGIPRPCFSVDARLNRAEETDAQGKFLAWYCRCETGPFRLL